VLCATASPTPILLESQHSFVVDITARRSAGKRYFIVIDNVVIDDDVDDDILRECFRQVKEQTSVNNAPQCDKNDELMSLEKAAGDTGTGNGNSGSAAYNEEESDDDEESIDADEECDESKRPHSKRPRPSYKGSDPRSSTKNTNKKKNKKKKKKKKKNTKKKALLSNGNNKLKTPVIADEYANIQDASANDIRGQVCETVNVIITEEKGEYVSPESRLLPAAEPAHTDEMKIAHLASIFWHAKDYQTDLYAANVSDNMMSFTSLFTAITNITSIDTNTAITSN
jgi:hypothetical protein